MCVAYEGSAGTSVAGINEAEARIITLPTPLLPNRFTSSQVPTFVENSKGLLDVTCRSIDADNMCSS